MHERARWAVALVMALVTVGCGDDATDPVADAGSGDGAIDSVGDGAAGDGAIDGVDGAVPRDPCHDVQPFEGGVSFPASGPRSAALGVARWALSGTPRRDGATVVEAMGFGAEGSLRALAWLETPTRGALAAIADGEASEAELADAVPAFALDVLPEDAGDVSTLERSPGEALAIWAEIADARPLVECLVAGPPATLDRTPGTPLAVCDAEQQIANAQLVVAVATSVKLVGCLAQQRLGLPFTTCDLEDLGGLAVDLATERLVDELDRAHVPDPAPIDGLDTTQEGWEQVVEEYVERVGRVKQMRAAKDALVRVLRLGMAVLDVVSTIQDFVDAWSPYVEALEGVECCQGGNPEGQSGCTCAERFPPDGEGLGGAPVWRRVSGARTSYVCEPCPEGSRWDPGASELVDDPTATTLARTLSRPRGDRGACVEEHEPPRWDACPRGAGGGLDFEALRARVEAFRAAARDPRVQPIDLQLVGQPCPNATVVRAYVRCDATGGTPYFMAPAGGAGWSTPPLPVLGARWTYHLGYRPEGMTERGEILPGTSDGFGTVWTWGTEASRDPVEVCDGVITLPVLGGRATGTPLVAYPDHALSDAERASIGLPEGAWCYDEIRFIDLAHHPETSNTCPPTLEGAYLGVLVPGDLVAPREPEHAERRCVGAIGSDTCVPPQALPLPGACGPAHRGPGAGCIADPHFVPVDDATELHGVSVASMDYADCCAEHPDGFYCRGVLGGLMCASAWSAMMRDAATPAATWRRLFATSPAPEALACFEGDAPSAYGRQLLAPMGRTVSLDDATFCESGALADTDDGARVCAPFGDDSPPGLTEPVVTPAGPASAASGGGCERVSEWDPVEMAWFVHRHETYVSYLNETLGSDWEAMSFYLQEIALRVPGNELWVARDGRGRVTGAALIARRVDPHDENDFVGFRMEALASAGRGFGPQLLDCVLDELEGRGDLPLEASPARAAESWWQRQAERIEADASRRYRARWEEDAHAWFFDAHCPAIGRAIDYDEIPPRAGDEGPLDGDHGGGETRLPIGCGAEVAGTFRDQPSRTWRLGWDVLPRTVRQAIRALARRGYGGFVDVEGRTIARQDLVLISQYLKREVGVLRNFANGRLVLMLGDRRSMPDAPTSFEFRAHTHPTLETLPSDLSTDIRNASDACEVVIDWNQHVTHFRRGGIVDASECTDPLRDPILDEDGDLR